MAKVRTRDLDEADWQKAETEDAPPAEIVPGVAVNVIRQDGKAALVEYQDVSGASVRKVIRNDDVQRDNTVNGMALEAGIPYGYNFTNDFKLKITSAALEAALHKRGIWTREDIALKSQMAHDAFMEAVAPDISALLNLAIVPTR